MVALDGFSINGVTKSTFIRESLSAKGYSLPRDNSSVMAMVHEFYDVAKQQTKEQIAKQKETKFSATLDEWTSLKNQRYLNVNIHAANGKFYNLGLIRIKNSCPAEVVIELMLQKLNEFGLSFADIVAATTDGAAVMCKFGRMICSTSIHQECYNHAIHLAVIEVLFTKVVAVPIQNEESDTEDESSDVDNDYDSGSDDGGVNESNAYEIRADLNEILKMVRQIVKLFKQSPLKNAALQGHIKAKHGKELALFLDCKTRWNSTEQMLERFVLVYESIVLALNDFNLNELVIDAVNMSMIKNVLKCLQPIKVAVEELGKRGANLLSAEAAINFLLESLEEQRLFRSGIL